MRVTVQRQADGTVYTLYKEKTAIGRAVLQGGCLCMLEVAPEWRRRGYGSYLLKELLRDAGGYAKAAPSLFTAPLPVGDNREALSLAARFGFVRQGDVLVRRRVPDLTAVELAHKFLADNAAHGGLYIDATCGNGHDTLFLCTLAGSTGRVLALDIQQQAVDSTNALLAAQGCAGIATARLANHRDLLQYAAPGTADGIIFNFGWLPGAAHAVYSSGESTLPALEAALEVLKPGGVLALVLYSGKTIGHSEKDAVTAWLKALPIAQYTALICSFANWADTAPLPCFVIKRPAGTLPPP